MNEQKNINDSKAIALYDDETLKYVQTHTGKAIYNKIGRPKKNETEKAKWSDKIICDVCGKTFIRSARSSHKKTKYHNFYSKMNAKLKKLLVD